MTFQDNCSYLFLCDLCTHVILFKNLAATRLGSHLKTNYKLQALISKTKNVQ